MPRNSSIGKSLDLQSKNCRFEPHCRRGVYLVLAFSKPLAPNCSVGSEHHTKNNGGPNHWIRVKIIPWLLKIHLSHLDKSSRISAGDV